VRVRAIIARLSPSQPPRPQPPEAFTVMHSADLDVHLAGVARPPSSLPPWPTATWDRHEHARSSEPSRLAGILLATHPAFVEPTCEDRHWMQVELAEAMAMEWLATGFTPSSAGRWASAQPGISSRQARELADAGLEPGDPMLVDAPRTIDLRARPTDVPATG
jgi:hypothetical protein